MVWFEDTNGVVWGHKWCDLRAEAYLESRISKARTGSFFQRRDLRETLKDYDKGVGVKPTFVTKPIFEVSQNFRGSCCFHFCKWKTPKTNRTFPGRFPFFLCLVFLKNQKLSSIYWKNEISLDELLLTWLSWKLHQAWKSFFSSRVFWKTRNIRALDKAIITLYRHTRQFDHHETGAAGCWGH